MIIRKLIFLIKLCLYSVLPLILLGWFIIYTQVGLKSLTFVISSFIPGKLQISQLTGSLKHGISFSSLTYESKNLDVAVDKLKTKWSFSLLQKSIYFDYLDAHNVTINNKDTSASATNSFFPAILKTVSIKNTTIHNFSFIQQNITVPLNNLKVALDLYNDTLEIKQLSFEYKNLSCQAHSLISIDKQLFYKLNIDIHDNATNKNISAYLLGLEQKMFAHIDFKDILYTSLKITGTFSKDFDKLKTKLVWDYHRPATHLKDHDRSNTILFDLDLKTKEFEFLPPKTSDPSKDVFYIKGFGKNKHVNIEDFHLTLANIALSGQMTIDWSTLITGTGQIKIANLTPTNDKYDLSIDAKYNPDTKNMTLLSNINQNNVHIGKINITKKNNFIDILQFNIKNNNDFVTITGNILDYKPKIKLDAHIYDLATYYPYWAGKIILNLNTTANTTTIPKFVLNLQAEQLKLFDISLHKADIKAKFNKDLSANIYIDKGKYNQFKVTEFRGNLKGTTNDHTFSYQLNLNEFMTNSQLSGKWKNNTWKGSINKLDITDPILNLWRLSKKAPVTINDSLISLSKLCVTSKKQTFCLAGDYKNYYNWDTKINANIEPELIAHYAENVILSNPLQLSSSLSVKDSKIVEYDLDVNTAQGKIKFGTLNKTYPFKQIKISGQLEKDLLKNTFVFESFEHDYAKGDISIHNTTFLLKKMFDAQLSGSINISFKSVNWLESFIPGAQRIDGKLNTTININGIVQNPNITGSLNVENGKVTVPIIGINFANINVTNKIENNSLDCNGSFTVNDTLAKLYGPIRLNKFNLPDFDATLEAENLLIYNKNDIVLHASPDVTFSSKQNSINTSGKVTITKGHVKIKDFSKTIELPQETIFFKEKSEKPFFPEIGFTYNVDLKVNPIPLSLFDLSATIEGDVNLIKSKKFTDSVFGTIHIKKGNYRLFGSDLIIESGSLLYRGNNLLNPHFELQAYKELDVESMYQTFSTSELSIIPEKVGIRATGKISKPELSFYSKPVQLTQSEIFSYLAFGTSIQNATKSERNNIFNAITLINSGDRDKNVIQNLQNALFLDQIGMQTRYSYDLPTTAEDLQNRKTRTAKAKETTAFVLGKRIFKRAFIQYYYDIDTNSHIFKSTYNLSKKWKLILENSSEHYAGNVQYEINLK